LPIRRRPQNHPGNRIRNRSDTVNYLIDLIKLPLSGGQYRRRIAVVHYFSTPYQMAKEALQKMNLNWENTAKLMGDSWLKTVWRILIPNSKVTRKSNTQKYLQSSPLNSGSEFAKLFLTSYLPSTWQCSPSSSSSSDPEFKGDDCRYFCVLLFQFDGHNQCCHFLNKCQYAVFSQFKFIFCSASFAI
jgi:hypothetical protein